MTARVSFVAICAIVLGLVGCNRHAFTVPGESMEPTFRRGDKVIANMWAYALRAPRRWDVVVVHPKTDELKDVVWVMRVVALPGETIAFSDGHILIDGMPLAQPRQIAAIRFKELPRTENLVPIVHPYTVPKECYYVVGDNVLVAYDSRVWGAL